MIKRISAERTLERDLQNGFGPACFRHDLKSQIAVIDADDKTAHVRGVQSMPQATFGRLDDLEADIDDLANRIDTEHVEGEIERRLGSSRTEHRFHGRLVAMEQRK